MKKKLKINIIKMLVEINLRGEGFANKTLY